MLGDGSKPSSLMSIPNYLITPRELLIGPSRINGRDACVDQCSYRSESDRGCQSWKTRPFSFNQSLS